MISLKKIALLSAGLSLMAFSGCNKNPAGPDDFDALDGNSGFVASEVSAMDDAAFDFNNIGAPKEFLGKAEAETIEVVINPWAYDSALKGWTRSSKATYPSGERNRNDIIWFFDANGDTIEQRPTLALVDSVYHVRNVTRSRNGNEVSNRLAMSIKLTKTADSTYAVKNGTITGTYNGCLFRTCTVTNVKRCYENGAWRFPVSGTIHIDRDAILPRNARTITVTFNGGGTATAEIVRKIDGKTIIVNITISNGEEA